MGLIKQKQNSISEAIEFYEKSLSIKPFEKSQIRLARILIDKKEYNKAQNIIKEIKSQNERSSI
jgi:predicted Zn-dependent protease